MKPGYYRTAAMAESQLIEAELKLEAAKDRASAVKAEARLVASVLESMLDNG